MRTINRYFYLSYLLISFTVFITLPAKAVKDIKDIVNGIEASHTPTAAELAQLEKAIADSKTKESQCKKAYEDHVSAHQQALKKTGDECASHQAKLDQATGSLDALTQENLKLKEQIQQKESLQSEYTTEEKTLLKNLKKAKDDQSKCKDKKKSAELKAEVESLEKSMDLNKKKQAKNTADVQKLKDECKNLNQLIVPAQKKVNTITSELSTLQANLTKADPVETRLKVAFETESLKREKLSASLDKAKILIAAADQKRKEQEEKAAKEAEAKAKAKAELEAKKKELEDKVRLEAEAEAKAELLEKMKKAKAAKARKKELKKKERRKERKAKKLKKKQLAKAKLLKTKKADAAPTPAKTVAIADPDDLSDDESNSEDTDEEESDGEDDIHLLFVTPCAARHPIAQPSAAPSPIRPVQNDKDEDIDDKKGPSPAKPVVSPLSLENIKSNPQEPIPAPVPAVSGILAPPPPPPPGFCTPRVAKYRVVKRTVVAGTGPTPAPAEAPADPKDFKSALIAQQKKRGIYVEQPKEVPATPAPKEQPEQPIVVEETEAPVAFAPPPPPPPMPVGKIVLKNKLTLTAPTTPAVGTPRLTQAPKGPTVDLTTILSARDRLKGKTGAQTNQQNNDTTTASTSTTSYVRPVEPVFIGDNNVDEWPEEDDDNDDSLSESDDEGTMLSLEGQGTQNKENVPPASAEIQDDQIQKLAAQAAAEAAFEERLKHLPGYSENPVDAETRKVLRQSMIERRNSFCFGVDGTPDNDPKSLNNSFFESSVYVAPVEPGAKLTPLEKIDLEIAKKEKESEALIGQYITQETQVVTLIKTKLVHFYNLDLSHITSFGDLEKHGIIDGKDLKLSNKITASDVIKGWEHFRKVSTARLPYQKSEANKKALDVAYKFAKTTTKDPVLTYLLPWGRKVERAVDHTLITDNLVRECQNIQKDLTDSLKKARDLIKQIHALKQSSQDVQNRLTDLTYWKGLLETDQQLPDDALRSLGINPGAGINLLDILQKVDLKTPRKE